MFSLLFAMGSILVTWLGLSAVFVGIGLIVNRAFRFKLEHAEQIFTSFWMGWATALIVLQIWHLRFRVDRRVFVLVSVLGFAGLWWNRKDIWELFSRSLSRYWSFYAIIVIFCIWLSNQAIGIPKNYDTGMYHLLSVRWASAYPIVPGLGNLYGPLAHNSSYFLYAAMLDIGPWTHKSHHLAIGLIFLPLIGQMLLGCVKLIQKQHEWRLARLLNIALLAAVLYMTNGGQLPSLGTDLPIFALGVVISVNLLSFLESPDKPADYTVFFITVLTVVGVTIKLSFLVFGGMATLVAFGVWIARYRQQRRQNLSSTRRIPNVFIWSAVCALVVMGIWVSRSIILSGYIAYPSTIGPVNVEWRVSREQALAEADWIRALGRALPGFRPGVLEGWDWLRPWAEQMAHNFVEVVAPCSLLTLGVALLILRKVFSSKEHLKPAHPPQSLPWLILIPAFSHLGFWFFSAPAIRFAGSALWVAGAGMFILALNEFHEPFRRRLLYPVFALFLLILVAGLRNASWVHPGSDHGFHPIPQIELKTFVTDAGLKIYTPAYGDRCWDAPLPCAPHPYSDLRLRRPEELSSGFIRQ